MLVRKRCQLVDFGGGRFALPRPADGEPHPLGHGCCVRTGPAGHVLCVMQDEAVIEQRQRLER